MTDRPTDELEDPKHWQFRGSDWEITAYDEAIDQLLRWVDNEEECPNFIERIMGGIEECPTTSKEHFQGYIKTQYDRKSKFKPYFPTTRIRKAVNPHALKKYVMKEETSVGRKIDWINPTFKTITDRQPKKEKDDLLTNQELLMEMIKFRINNIGEHINAPPGKHVKEIVTYWYKCDPDFVSKYLERLSSQRFREMYNMFGQTIYSEMIYQKEKEEYR